jgi:hypothetical protein
MCSGIFPNLFPLSCLLFLPQVLGLCVERLGASVVREHVGLVMGSLLEHLGDERIAIRHHTLQVRLLSEVGRCGGESKDMRLCL